MLTVLRLLYLLPETNTGGHLKKSYCHSVLARKRDFRTIHFVSKDLTVRPAVVCGSAEGGATDAGADQRLFGSLSIAS